MINNIVKTDGSLNYSYLGVMDDRIKDIGLNVKDYNVSGSNVSTTGSITTGTNQLTVSSIIDFAVGQGVSVAGIYEVANLSVTAGATSSANCTVTLHGVAFNISLTSGYTATQVATAIRATTFIGWTTGGSGTTVTFTSTSTGNKTDATYSAGTTGATGTMTTTTQGTSNFVATINSISGTTFTLSSNATTTLSGVVVSHDDTVAISTFINSITNGTIIFPKGSYYLSKQGTRLLSWSGTQEAYGILLLNKSNIDIIFESGANIFMDISDTNTFNAIWIENCTNVKVINSNFTGSGTTGSKIEHEGVGVLITNSTKIIAERPYSTYIRGCARAYNSDECTINNGFSSIYANEHSTGHFCLFSCTSSLINNCTNYGATLDGEIFIYGGGSINCSIINCKSYCYVYGDSTKTIINGQGIMIDSGGVNCKIIDCYGYGYYYAFGVKNSSEGCIISGCFAEQCKIGIYVGKGEGTSRCNVVTITNNTIVPNGGNGDVTPFLGSITIPLGIAVTDSYGGTIISGNTVYNSITNQANKDFVGLLLALSDATSANAQGTYSITGNNFILQNRNGTFYGTSRAQAIAITTNFQIFNVEITGNTFQLPDIGMINNVIDVANCYGVSVSNNTFSEIGTTGLPIIKVNLCQRIKINSNNFSYHSGILEAYSSKGISFSNNISGESISGVGKAVLKFDACSSININGNTQIIETSLNLDDIYFILQNASDKLSVQGNVLNIFNKNYTNWYTNGATNSSIMNNIINGVSTNLPPYIVPTLVNGWVNYGGVEDVAGYYKDDSGIVHIEGMVKSGTLSVAIFVLPVGYRPLKTKRFAILSNGVFASVAVAPDGTINIDANGSPVYVSLANISFRAEQ